jgi:hypothetical protein
VAEIAFPEKGLAGVEPDLLQMRGGSHFLGETELVAHVGLGPEFEAGVDVVHRVEIEWPTSGIVQGFDSVADGQTLLVLEGE